MATNDTTNGAKGNDVLELFQEKLHVQIEEDFSTATTEEKEWLKSLLAYMPDFSAEWIKEKTMKDAVRKFSENIYKVSISNGGHLAKSRTCPGAFKSLVFENGHSKGPVDLLPVGESLRSVVSTPVVFWALKFIGRVAKEAYDKQLDSRINELQEHISGIEAYLEIQRVNEFKALSQKLNNARAMMTFDSNTGYSNVSWELKDIRSRAEAQCFNYDDWISKLLKKLKSVKAESKALQIIDELCASLNLYLRMVAIWGCAEFLDMHIAISNRTLTKEGVCFYYERYKKTKDSFSRKLADFEETGISVANQIKELNIEPQLKIPYVPATSNPVAQNPVVAFVANVAVKATSDYFYERRKTKTTQKKEIFINSFNKRLREIEVSALDEIEAFFRLREIEALVQSATQTVDNTVAVASM